MPYVQNKNRDGKLKSGPLANYSQEAEEAQQKELKRSKEIYNLKLEQERSRQAQLNRDRETIERVKMYKERKKRLMSRAIGGRFAGNAASQLSGTVRARIARDEGGSTAKA